VLCNVFPCIFSSVYCSLQQRKVRQVFEYTVGAA
jgi:hypothetical protein